MSLMVKEQFKKIMEDFAPKRKNIRTFAILAIIILSLILLGFHSPLNRFNEAIWIFDMLLLGALFLSFMLMAGLAVLKSLFFVAAELSLLIFLSQSYCSVSNPTVASNDALKSLLNIGLLYIVFSFGTSVYNEIKEYYKKFENDSQLEKILSIIAFLVFAGFFIWQIYLIVNPIVLNLCVYR